MTKMEMKFQHGEIHTLRNLELSLPIDPKAIIYQVEIQNGPKNIVTIVKEKEEATKIFRNATLAGHGAYLGRRESTQSDVYQFSVGNLLPNQLLIARVYYVVEIQALSPNLIRISIPVGLFERYSPSTSQFSTPPHLSSSNVAPVKIDHQTPISIHILLRMSIPIVSVTSSTSSPFKFNNRTPSTSTSSSSSSYSSSESTPLSLSSPVSAEVISLLTSESGAYSLEVELGRSFSSFLLLTDPNPSPPSHSLPLLPLPSRTLPQENTFPVGVVVVPLLTSPSLHPPIPPLPLPPPPPPPPPPPSSSSSSSSSSSFQHGRFVFLLDRSGSMYTPVPTSGSLGLGPPLDPPPPRLIDLALQALRSALTLLPLGCGVQIIGFGSIFEPLSPTLVPLTDSSLQSILTATKGMTSSLGGTEMMKPLQHLLHTLPRLSYLPLSQTLPPLYIILLTDGEVTNQRELGSAAQSLYSLCGARIFSFGIGSGSSRSLVETIAEKGGGAWEVVENKDLLTPLSPLSSSPTNFRTSSPPPVLVGAVEEKVRRLLQKLSSPSLLGLTFTVRSSSRPSSPPHYEIQEQSHSPPLLHSSVGLYSLLLSGKPSLPLSIDVNGTAFFPPSLSLSSPPPPPPLPPSPSLSVTGSFPHSFSISHSALLPSSALLALVSTPLLRLLETSYDDLDYSMKELKADHQNHPSDKQREGEMELQMSQLRARAVNLSVSSSVLCRWTAHIGVEIRENNNITLEEEEEQEADSPPNNNNFGIDDNYWTFNDANFLDQTAGLMARSHRHHTKAFKSLNKKTSMTLLPLPVLTLVLLFGIVIFTAYIKLKQTMKFD